jgi:hypothetical protein
LRHSDTDWRDTPRLSAMTALEYPSAAHSNALARTTSRHGLEYAAARRRNSRSCSAVSSIPYGLDLAIASQVAHRPPDSCLQTPDNSGRAHNHEPILSRRAPP